MSYWRIPMRQLLVLARLPQVPQFIPKFLGFGSLRGFDRAA